MIFNVHAGAFLIKCTTNYFIPFDAIVEGILNFFLDCLLFAVNRTAVHYCILILYPVSLPLLFLFVSSKCCVWIP